MEQTAVIKGVQLGFKFISFLKNLKKRKIYGIVMSSSSGKSTLVTNLRGDGIRPIDLDDYTYKFQLSREEQVLCDDLKKNNVNAYDTFFESKAKKYVNSIMDDYPNDVLLIIGSSPRVLKSVGCTHLRYYVPSEDLFNEIRKTITEAEKDDAEIIATRTKLISQAGDKLKIFKTFTHLYDGIKAWLKLKETL